MYSVRVYTRRHTTTSTQYIAQTITTTHSVQTSVVSELITCHVFDTRVICARRRHHQTMCTSTTVTAYDSRICIKMCILKHNIVYSKQIKCQLVLISFRFQIIEPAMFVRSKVLVVDSSNS